MKVCKQCLKERNEFRVLKSGFTYNWCTHCEALNKRLYHLNRFGKTDWDEFHQIKAALLQLHNNGGKLQKGAYNIVFGIEGGTTEQLIDKVLGDDNNETV